MKKPILAYLLKKLRERMSEDKIILYQDQIVLAITRSTNSPVKREDFNAIESFLMDNHLYGGISAAFTSMKQFYAHYLQAVMSLEIGRALSLSGLVYWYEDIAVYHLIEICSRDGDVGQYIHPSIHDIIEHDRGPGDPSG